jgi:hypothetical protein
MNRSHAKMAPATPVSPSAVGRKRRRRRALKGASAPIPSSRPICTNARSPSRRDACNHGGNRRNQHTSIRRRLGVAGTESENCKNISFNTSHVSEHRRGPSGAQFRASTTARIRASPAGRNRLEAKAPRRARGDAGHRRDRAGRGDRPGQHQIHQGGQPGGGAVPLEPAFQAPAREQPAVVLGRPRSSRGCDWRKGPVVTATAGRSRGRCGAGRRSQRSSSHAPVWN